MDGPGIDHERVGDAAVELAAQLVRLDTVNPGLVPGAAGERAAVDLLRRRLDAAGFACEVVEPAHRSGRPSLLATRATAAHTGSAGSAEPGEPRRHLLLNGHLDTVGVDGMTGPFTARIEGDRHTGRLHGRGACDMKAGVAGMVVAAEAVAATDPGARVTLALVADEEDESIGTSAVLAHLDRHGLVPDACLVGEPTWLDLAVAHRGFAVVEVELRGVAAHSSRPQDGVNAVTHLGRLLAAVESGDRALSDAPPHPLLGHGSLMATVAHGGSAPFTVAAAAYAVVERRLLPGEPVADTVPEVERLIGALAAEDPAVDAGCRLRLGREAWEQDGTAESTKLAALLADELAAAGAPEPHRVGAPYWMESALWQGAGVPTVVCGPAGGGLHSDVEWVDLAQLRAYAVALAAAVPRFC